MIKPGHKILKLAWSNMSLYEVGDSFIGVWASSLLVMLDFMLQKHCLMSEILAKHYLQSYSMQIYDSI